jgi:hypothetical protein
MSKRGFGDDDSLQQRALPEFKQIFEEKDARQLRQDFVSSSSSSSPSSSS